MRGSIVMTLGVAVAIGCGDTGGRDTTPHGVLFDSAGVAIWTVSGTDFAADFQLAPVTRLALPDSGWIAWPDGIAVDREESRIYVLDEAAPRILMFGFDGAFQGQLGRKGQGPGEYDSPLALATDMEGALFVMDPGAGAIHQWSRDLGYVGREEISPTYWGPGFAVTRRGPVYTTAGSVGSGVMTEALVHVISTTVDTAATVQSRWKILDMPCGRVPVPEVMSRASVWAAADDLVAFTAVPEYVIDLTLSGEIVASFRRDLGPRAVRRDEAEASVPLGPLQFLVEGCGMTPAALVRQAGFVDEVSPLVMLTIDASDRLWAARGADSTVEVIDVFGAEMGYLGSIPSPAFPWAFLDRSRFVTALPSDWGTVLEIWEVLPRR